MNLDIHTHNYRPDDPCTQVLNIRLAPDFATDCLPPPANNLLLSAGIHPWDTESFNNASSGLEDSLFRILSHDRIEYIGEIGIDKLRGAPVPHQIKLLQLQLSIANRLRKPVIIHCVKAMQEIMALKNDCPDIPEWIIHGFRGKATQARQWINHGFSLSFGLQYDPEAFALCPPNRKYRESDDREMGKNDYLCSLRETKSNKYTL